MRIHSDRILVKVDLDQKGIINIGGEEFNTTLEFNTNYRERNPILAIVLEDHPKIKKGTMICCHHNRFHEYSAYKIQDDIFAIPYTNSIFFRIDKDGEPHSICGNIICERVPIEYDFEVPASYQKNYIDRVVVVNNGYGYKKGDQVFTVKMADYEVVYNWQHQERRVIKVLAEDILCCLSASDRAKI